MRFGAGELTSAKRSLEAAGRLAVAVAVAIAVGLGGREDTVGFVSLGVFGRYGIRKWVYWFCCVRECVACGCG